jgi:hypothetical protein
MVTSIKGNDTSTFGGNVDVTGNVTDDKPVFSATNTANNTISDNVWTKVIFNNKLIDTHNAFDTTNYKFVVPSGQGGTYQLLARVRQDSGGAANLLTSQVAFYFNTSRLRVEYFNANNNALSAYAHSFQTIVNLNAGDQVEVYSICNTVSGSPFVNSAIYYIEFSGHRIA